MFPRNEIRSEGTFTCTLGTSVHSPKPPFYETALLSPGEESGKSQKNGEVPKKIKKNKSGQTSPNPDFNLTLAGFQLNFNRIPWNLVKSG